MNINAFYCFAHRGAAGYEPENTLRSFQKAIDLKSPWLELDVHLNGDELIVFHDETLERITQTLGRIDSMPIENLQLLDAGKGEKIPTLREVLNLANRRINFNIELKGKNTAKKTVEIIHEYIQKGWDLNQFIICSFNAEELAKVHTYDSQINIGYLVDVLCEESIKEAREMNCFSIHPWYETVNTDTLALAHQHSLKVFPFTVNWPENIEAMLQLHVDGIISDFPDRVMSFINMIKISN